MSEPEQTSCPRCQARLDLETLRDSAASVCPFCAEDVSELLAREGFENSREPLAFETEQDTGDGRQSSVAVPPGSKIQVMEHTPGKLVLYLPAGGRGTGLGCFAVAWNGFMVVFTALFVFAGFGKGDFEGNPLVGVFVFGLFWAVGLVIAWTAVKMRYERTFLYLDAQRAVLQRMLFSFKSRCETELGPNSRAELQEAYAENDNPVYRVAIVGGPRSFGFGVGQSDADKDWLVDVINRQLGVDTVPVSESASSSTVDSIESSTPANCRQCGTPLSVGALGGETVCEQCGAVHRLPTAAENGPDLPALKPDELPEGSGIRVEVDEPDELRLSYPPTTSPSLRWLLPVFLAGFSVAWLSGCAAFTIGAIKSNLLPIQIGFVLFSIPFWLIGSALLTIASFMLLGRITVCLTREKLSARWSVGQLGFSRSLPVEELRSIAVGESGEIDRRRRRVPATADSTSEPDFVCMARAGERVLLLTVMHDVEMSRRLAALLITRLGDWGIRLRGSGDSSRRV